MLNSFKKTISQNGMSPLPNFPILLHTYLTQYCWPGLETEIERRLIKGVRGLYDGLTGTLLRQMTYSMMRFAAYDWAKTVVHTGMSLFPLNITPSKRRAQGTEQELTNRYNNSHPGVQNGFSRINGWWNCWIPRESSRIDNGQDAG